MEIFKVRIKPQSEIEKHEAFKKSLHDCPLCETSLQFELEAGNAPFQLIEKAHCPTCDLPIRTTLHTEH